MCWLPGFLGQLLEIAAFKHTLLIITTIILFSSLNCRYKSQQHMDAMCRVSNIYIYSYCFKSRLKVSEEGETIIVIAITTVILLWLNSPLFQHIVMRVKCYPIYTRICIIGQEHWKYESSIYIPCLLHLLRGEKFEFSSINTFSCQREG